MLTFLLPAIWACREDMHDRTAPGNLIANGDLSQWSTDSNRLKDWETTAAVQGVITARKNDGMQFSGNTGGAFYISQRVSVDSGRFYMATVNAGYNIHNYFSCGLYIMDSSLRITLGKFERTYSDGNEETWKVVFRPKAKGQVAVVIGFLNGINASAYFRNITLNTYDYRPAIQGGALGTYLSRKFPLEFSPAKFDSTVCRVADYVNSVLLCKYTYHKDTAELLLLDSLIGRDSGYAWFNKYRAMVDQLPVAYCQKSSLSLAEILTNEFHVPTRQVHMVFGTTGKHQFTEYWDPFAEKWIAVDPCFNTHYLKDGALAGVNDFTSTEAPHLIRSFGTHVFHSFLPYGLPWYWTNMDRLQITDHYSLTFPYSR